MGHTVTGKLNKDARQFQNDNGMVFFVDIGEANYNRKTKEKEYTNYSAALFAKDNQVGFYTNALVAGSVISVGGSGLIIDMPNDPKYQPRLQIQDSKLEFVYTGKPHQQPQAAPQQKPAAQQQAPGFDTFDDDDPF